MKFIQRLKGRYYIWRYARWYKKMMPVYMADPQRVKDWCLRLKWQRVENPEKFGEVENMFIEHMEGWLKQGGNW